MADLREPGQAIACEFRIINEFDGLRWLRLISEPPLVPGASGADRRPGRYHVRPGCGNAGAFQL